MGDAAAVVLALMLVVALVSGGALVAWLLHSARQDRAALRAEADALRKRLQERERAGTAVGLAYQTSDRDVRGTMERLQRVLSAFQKAGCNEVHADFMLYKAALLDALRKQREDMPCGKLRDMASAFSRHFAEELARGAPAAVDTAELAAALRALWEHVIDVGCGGAGGGDRLVDVARLDAYATEVFAAVCKRG